MSENLMCSNHKASNEKSRKNYDNIRWNKERESERIRPQDKRTD